MSILLESSRLHLSINKELPPYEKGSSLLYLIPRTLLIKKIYFLNSSLYESDKHTVFGSNTLHQSQRDERLTSQLVLLSRDRREASNFEKDEIEKDEIERRESLMSSSSNLNSSYGTGKHNQFCLESSFVWMFN
ncbi:hypothetical protein YC2023_017356 [Brassica napus]